MMRFIGKFEFRKISSNYGKDTPEGRIARKLAKTLRGQNRDKALQKIHERYYTYPYEPRDYDIKELLDNDYHTWSFESSDDYDFVKDPDYFVEQLNENSPPNINAILQLKDYILYEGDYPSGNTYLQKPTDTNDPEYEISRYRDAVGYYDENVGRLIDEELMSEDDGMDIITAFRQGKIDPYYIDPNDMMDLDDMSDDDLRLFLDDATIERIKQKYENLVVNKDINEIREHIMNTYNSPVMFIESNNKGLRLPFGEKPNKKVLRYIEENYPIFRDYMDY